MNIIKATKIGYTTKINIPAEISKKLQIENGEVFEYVLDMNNLTMTIKKILPEPQEEPESGYIFSDAELAQEYEAIRAQELEADRIDEEFKLQKERLAKLRAQKQELINKSTFLATLNENKKVLGGKNDSV